MVLTLFKMRFLLRFAFISAALTSLLSFTHKFAGDPEKTALLIAYPPVMHLSDADAEIARRSGINVRQARSVMRNSITERLALRLRESFCVRHLTEAGTAKEKDDLNNFYDSENFYMSSRDTSLKLFASEPAQGENPYFDMFRKNASPVYESSYMNVSLAKPVLFEELSASYQADCFVVLTQLQIKTHYDECMDISHRVFRREFLLHFAVFDAQGNQTGGNAVSYEAGSDVNTINKITYDIFPQLAAQVSRHVSASAR